VAGRFDIAEYASGYGYDPDDSLLLTCDLQWPRGLNFGFYCNKGLDALFQRELATTDAGQRQSIFDQEHLIYVTDYPLIVLFSQLDVSVVRKGAHNYAPSPFVGATINVWQWWCDQGRC
jgi:ABC-type transport system substrate-binding protein